jgi:hypothetical protein
MRTRTFVVIATGAALCAPVAALAASPRTEAPAAAAASALPKPDKAYVISGFRSARFGMNEAQVRSAIGKDFGRAAKIEKAANAAEGTTAMQASLAALDPGPGPAKVTYIFGATSKELIHINVVWASNDQPTHAVRQAMMQAGLELLAYFKTHIGKPKAAAAGLPNGPNTLVLYVAVDESGASVELSLDGIAFEHKVDGKTVSSPPADGPVSLAVSYARNVLQPDIKTIARGAY